MENYERRRIRENNSTYNGFSEYHLDLSFRNQCEVSMSNNSVIYSYPMWYGLSEFTPVEIVGYEVTETVNPLWVVKINKERMEEKIMSIRKRIISALISVGMFDAAFSGIMPAVSEELNVYAASSYPVQEFRLAMADTDHNVTASGVQLAPAETDGTN
ncbi:MAG: hypothetical protein K2F73_00340, partial [Ruminococcus sp.]|nr:hypothetical protein [Ruminococcus sp.]